MQEMKRKKGKAGNCTNYGKQMTGPKKNMILFFLEGREKTVTQGRQRVKRIDTAMGNRKNLVWNQPSESRAKF